MDQQQPAAFTTTSMASVLFRKFETARRIGLLRAMRIALDRFFLGLLARVFEFHRWHAEAPTSARAYRHTAARLVNELRPNTVVEVGCGLGGILSQIQAEKRYGYDADEGAIRAARFLHGKQITFVHGGLLTVSQERIDVLILVNWIHEISPQLLEELVTPLLSRTRYLLLDAIDPGGPDYYRYKHDFTFLDGLACRRSVTRPPDEGRAFHLFEVGA